MIGTGKIHWGESVKSLGVRKLRSCLFDEVPFDHRPEKAREQAMHMFPGRVKWEDQQGKVPGMRLCFEEASPADME